MYRGMPGGNAPYMKTGNCVLETPQGDRVVDSAEFINHFSVTYWKGYFVLKAEFNGSTNYNIQTRVGTDMGVCTTINPAVSHIPCTQSIATGGLQPT